MFQLVHFSRVFPFIHPCLFPVEPAAEQPQAREGAVARDASGRQDAPAGAGPLSEGLLQARRLKSLYRRRQLSLRSDPFTYSSPLRPAVR